MNEMKTHFKKGETANIRVDAEYLLDDGNPVRFRHNYDANDTLVLTPVYSFETGYDGALLEEGCHFEFMDDMPRQRP